MMIIECFLNHFSQKILLGKLFEDKNKKIYFQYDKKFLDNGFSISPFLLPLKSEVQTPNDYVFNGLFGVFGDCVADGFNRLILDRFLAKLGLFNISDFQRLAYTNTFSIGALSFEPNKDLKNNTEDKIHLDIVNRKIQEILGDKQNSIDVLQNLQNLGGGSAGARPKIMVQVSLDKEKILTDISSLRTGYEHYIIKFPSYNDDKNLALMEYEYSLYARLCGIDVCDTFLFKTRSDNFFGIKRFDRIGNARIHTHSIAGLVHSDFRYPSLDYDDLLKITFILTKDAQEVKKMFRLACFNLFFHNQDDHAKNFSFLMDKDGLWKLAPAYDLTYSYGLNGEHSTTFMREGKNPSFKDLEKLAKKHKIREYDIIIEEILKVKKDVK